MNLDNAEYVGELEVEDGIYSILKTDTTLIYGIVYNTGLCPLGSMEIDDCFSIDENLSALVEQIEAAE